MEILSYNIEIGKKLDDVASWIAQENLDPDIFCFQEFPEEKMAMFTDFLKKRGYAYAYAPGIILRGIPIGELTAHKENRMRLLQGTDLKLGSYFLEKYRPVKGQRSALITSYRIGDDVFSIANVHLSVFSPHSMRYKQLELVMQALHELSSRAVIIGDFNYTSLLGVRRLFKFMGRHDYTVVGEKLITHRIFNHIPQQIDYVFQKGFVPRAINVLPVKHSDHFPLTTKLDLL